MKKYDYWTMLKQLLDDYNKENRIKVNMDDKHFNRYLGEVYGFKIAYEDGYIVQKPRIVNQEKYLMFTLKYL
jgi:hypothetical protein